MYEDEVHEKGLFITQFTERYISDRQVPMCLVVNYEIFFKSMNHARLIILYK